MDDFILRAIIGGVGITLVTGPLGAFVVWRRMAYFGDTIAHSALLGVAGALLLDLAPGVAIVISSLLIAMLLVLLQKDSRFSADTLLGILAHGSLSVGLVLVALSGSGAVDLNAYLFGDILAIGQNDIALIYATSFGVLLLLCANWRKLLLMTIHEEVARVEGVQVERTRFMLMLAIALVVAIAIKLVGMLLITSLLIIPAATARYYASSPARMAVLASLIGVAAVLAGVEGSLQWDTPTGPSIVVAALALFVVTCVGAAFNKTR